jgi:hypothetical protein
VDGPGRGGSEEDEDYWLQGEVEVRQEWSRIVVETSRVVESVEEEEEEDGENAMSDGVVRK